MSARRIVRRKEQPIEQASFSFDFDDSADSSSISIHTSAVTGAQRINSVLEQSSTTGDYSIPISGIKLKETTPPVPTAANKPTISPHHEMLPCPESITLYHPTLLNNPQPIYQSHIIPKSQPGVHVIYAPTLPTSCQTMLKKKKSSQKIPPGLKLIPKQTPTKPPTATETLSSASLPLYPTPVVNYIPKWVLGIEALNPNDFECPLSSLPDIMIDPESYFISLPNPTDYPRNIFVSIAAPLRCVTGDSEILESAFSQRKFNYRDDKYLLPCLPTRTNTNKSTPKEQPWYEQQVLSPNTINPTSIFSETTTFAVVIPPKSVIDLCHIITTAHTHLSLSNLIKTETFQSLEFLQEFLSQPLYCPTLLKDICRDNMPLELAQRYISNHISSTPQSSTLSSSPFLTTSSLPNFIPLLSFPLPLPSTYLFTQTSAGTMTHHSPQTKYAIDIACAQNTPVYAPCDGVIDGVEAKSCSIGNHVTNLFDWNSITLKSRCNEAFTAFSATNQIGDKKNDNTNATPYKTTFHISTSNLSSHNLTQSDKDAFNGWMYIDLVHLQTILVQKGQFVKHGQLLGYTGSTGFSPSPHLHIQVSLSSEPTAPTIPFSFKYNSISPSAAAFAVSPSPIATLAEAGFAYNGSELVTLEEYHTISAYAKSYYEALNEQNGTFTVYPKETFQDLDECCINLDNLTVCSTLPHIDGEFKPKGTNNHTSIPYHTALTIASMLGVDTLPKINSTTPLQQAPLPPSVYSKGKYSRK